MVPVKESHRQTDRHRPEHYRSHFHMDAKTTALAVGGRHAA